MELAPGVQEETELRQGGFSEDEIGQWRNKTQQELLDGGFSPKEIDGYFGKKEFNGEGLKEHFKANLDKVAAAEAGKELSTNANVYGPEPVKEADGLLEAWQAGWQMSVAGLLSRDRTPDTILPEHAGSFQRIASQVGTIVGDAIPMAVGGAAGGVAGTAVGGPGIGSAMGAGAGANALPEAMRTYLMQAYNKGEVKNFEDFWERSSSIFLQTLKSGTVGAATFGVGNKVGKIVGSVAAPQIVKSGTVAASEIATMVNLGKALEGQVPEPSDFLDAAVVIGAMHLGAKVASNGYERIQSKLMDVYSKTGNTPSEVAAMAQKDPTIQQDLLSDNLDVPNSLRGELPTGDKLPADMTQLKQGLTPEDAPHVRINLAEPKIEETPRELSEAEQRVLSKIKPFEKKKTPVTWDEMKTETLDALFALKDFTKTLGGDEPVDTIDNSYEMARLMGGNSGRAQQFIEHSTYNFHTTENDGPSLKAILKPVAKDLDGWRAYAASKRAIELDARGKVSGFDINDAKQIVQEGSGKYEKVTQEIYKYQDRLINYLVDAQVLSSKDVNAFKEANKAYVPFNRLMEEGPGKSPGTGLEPRNPIKRLMGSERDIIDPIETIIRNTHLYIAMAERNRVMLTMKKAADKSDVGAMLMQHMKPKNVPVEIKSEEVSALLAEYGIDDIDPTPFTVFRPDRRPLANNEIQVFSKGKRQIYEVDKNVAAAVRALDRENVPLVIKMLNYPVKTLRAGVTLSPDFIGRNVFRDQIPAYVQSKYGYVPVVDAVRGLGGLLKHDEDFQNWLKGGGANGDIMSIDQDYIAANISQLAKQTGIMNQAFNVVKYPFQLLHVMSELSEQSSRVGDFKKATKDDKSAENIFRSAFDSRELVIDYKKIGANSSIRAMNLITAFWNARVQGLDRTVRAFQDDPFGATTKSLVSVTLPSVLLWYANKDDPRWNDGSIPRWQKDLFWIVMTDKHIWRIPKPFELGILFGSVPERVLDSYFTHNPKAFKDLSDTLLQGINPGYVATAVSPFVEHFSNKSMFTGGPIIPSNLEKLLPEYQYTDYTTETAKKLGQFVGSMTNKRNSFSSPAVIENYIRAWTGNTGLYALQLADQALIAAGVVDNPHKPAAKIEEWPFIKAFMIRNPSRQNQNIQDFYKKYNEVNQDLVTVKALGQRGDETNMSKELERSDNLMKLTSIHNSLSRQDAYVHKIIQNPDIAPAEKTQLIDGMIEGMIQTATAGLSAYEEFEKEMKQTGKK